MNLLNLIHDANAGGFAQIFDIDSRRLRNRPVDVCHSSSQDGSDLVGVRPFKLNAVRGFVLARRCQREIAGQRDNDALAVLLRIKVGLQGCGGDCRHGLSQFAVVIEFTDEDVE